MAIGADPQDLISEDGIGTVKYCTEYTYLGIKIIRNGNHDDDIYEIINKGRSAIS